MSKSDNRPQGAGTLRNKLQFYPAPDQTDSGGAPINTLGTMLWETYGRIEPYQGFLQREAGRELGETWATFVIRYHTSRLPLEAMRVVVKQTGETWEVRGVDHLQYNKILVNLTMRQVR